MSDSGYAVIYCDPPWQYGRRQHAGAGKPDTGGAESHYPTMGAKELAALPVSSVAAADAVLFMWATSPLLDQAVALFSAWGFTYKTVSFVWYKQRTNPGYYTMSQCELCLVGKRGKIPQPRGARNVRQFVDVKRGRHSEKPAEVADRIVEMFPHHKRIELFARTQRAGWDVWGNECSSEPTAARILGGNNER